MPTPILLPDESGYLLWPDGSIVMWGEEPQVTYTLFDLTYMVARELGLTEESIATGGSTTTLVDTVMRDEPDDYWNEGTIWVLRDAGGAGAAPEGEYSRISDFVSSTGTMTLIDPLTAAIAGGDRYACMTSHVPLDVIIQKINDSLMELGPVPYVDITSITIQDNKTEYTLPIASKHDLREVYLETNLDVVDHQWVKLYNWDVQQSDPGATPTLVLPEQYTAGYALKLVYMANHLPLRVYDAVLLEDVPVERVITPAVLACFEYRKRRTGWNTWDDEIRRYELLVEQVKLYKRVRKPARTSHIPLAGDQSQANSYPGDRTPR